MTPLQRGRVVVEMRSSNNRGVNGVQKIGGAIETNMTPLSRGRVEMVEKRRSKNHGVYIHSTENGDMAGWRTTQPTTWRTTQPRPGAQSSYALAHSPATPLRTPPQGLAHNPATPWRTTPQGLAHNSSLRN